MDWFEASMFATTVKISRSLIKIGSQDAAF